MSEQAPHVTHQELMDSIAQANIAASEVGKHSAVRVSKRNYTRAHGSNRHGGDALSTDIKRAKIRDFGNNTEIDITAAHPHTPEDPYHRKSTEYSSRIDGRYMANTRIERRDNKGNVVYTHETDNLQLARRLGELGARSIVRQSAERAETKRVLQERAPKEAA